MAKRKRARAAHGWQVTPVQALLAPGLTVERTRHVLAQAPVEIVPYDPDWSRQFLEEAEALRRAMTPWPVGAIEHIGSTAVPGLGAKPVIDIRRVCSRSTNRVRQRGGDRSGLQHAPYQADVEHWFCKPSFSFRTHHLRRRRSSRRQWLPDCSASISARSFGLAAARLLRRNVSRREKRTRCAREGLRDDRPTPRPS